MSLESGNRELLIKAGLATSVVGFFNKLRSDEVEKLFSEGFSVEPVPIKFLFCSRTSFNFSIFKVINKFLDDLEPFLFVCRILICHH